jgi:hypothetical protein
VIAVSNAITVGAIGVTIGALFTWINGQRALRSANILAERTKWRDRIRELAQRAGTPLSLVEADRLWREMALLLNPRDVEDRELIRQIARLGADMSLRDEVTARIALLLKHDWERAKIEASWLPYRDPDRIFDRTFRSKDMLGR